VYSVAFSPDNRTIASGNFASAIKLWDAASGRQLRTLQGHTGNVESVAFSPDGRTIASGSNDLTIKLRDLVASAPMTSSTERPAPPSVAAAPPAASTWTVVPQINFDPECELGRDGAMSACTRIIESAGMGGSNHDGNAQTIHLANAFESGAPPPRRRSTQSCYP
jgi:WD40 repeat protein